MIHDVGKSANDDERIIRSCCDEWSRFDQSEIAGADAEAMFGQDAAIFA